MKKRIVAMLLCFSTVFSMMACGKSEGSSSGRTRTSETDPSTVTASEIQTDKNFIRDTSVSRVTEMGEGHNYNRAAAMVDFLDTGKNTILSETSLNMALALLNEGASGTSKQALDDFLTSCYNLGDGADISKRSNELINAYYNNRDVQISLANSIWTDESINLTGDYKMTLSEYYNANAVALPFKDGESADVINDWCSDATNGKITKIVTPEILSASKNVLINALYFNGTWADPFEDYAVNDEEFTNADGTTTTVSMMRSTEGTYYENEYATGFSKVYEGGSIRFIGILPKNEGEFNLADLDIDSFMESATYEYDVNIGLPKYKIEDSNSLTDVLKDNGLGAIFEAQGDFYDMCNETDLYVSDVIQKTYVDVNEKGTEAAAVTAIVMEDACVMVEESEIKEVILDRAFAFMIYDSANDEILFMGKVNNL